MLIGVESARPAVARLYFVDDQQDIPRMTERRDRADILLPEHVHSALALDEFQHDRARLARHGGADRVRRRIGIVEPVHIRAKHAGCMLSCPVAVSVVNVLP